MKRSTSLLAACVLAGAAMGSAPVLAADISTPPQAIDLVDNTAGFFGDSFGIDNQGNTFADRFTFRVSETQVNLDSIVASISRSATTGLNITGFSLFGNTDNLLASGTTLESGAIDVWRLSGNALAPGNYYLRVDGTVVSNGAAAFGGAILLSPVPEPATYGMLAGGLALLGFAARRKT